MPRRLEISKWFAVCHCGVNYLEWVCRISDLSGKFCILAYRIYMVVREPFTRLGAHSDGLVGRVIGPECLRGLAMTAIKMEIYPRPHALKTGISHAVRWRTNPFAATPRRNLDNIAH